MATSRRNGKARRIQERLFADSKRFSASGGKFSPLPWCLRRVLWLFAPRTWQVLTYLMMRSGQEGVTWHTDKQIALDIGVTFRKVAPHLRQLEKQGFILMKEHDGDRYVCLLDPLFALDALVRKGAIHSERLEALNEDLETMGLSQLPMEAVIAAAAEEATTVASRDPQTAPAASPDKSRLLGTAIADAASSKNRFKIPRASTPTTERG
ncbi:MAG: hypothetical protein ABTD50_23645 [Polyangiaceae bacterium]|jgi:hypothetical protein